MACPSKDILPPAVKASIEIHTLNALGLDPFKYKILSTKYASLLFEDIKLCGKNETPIAYYVLVKRRDGQGKSFWKKYSAIFSSGPPVIHTSDLMSIEEKSSFVLMRELEDELTRRALSKKREEMISYFLESFHEAFKRISVRFNLPCSFELHQLFLMYEYTVGFEELLKKVIVSLITNEGRGFLGELLVTYFLYVTRGELIHRFGISFPDSSITFDLETAGGKLIEVKWSEDTIDIGKLCQQMMIAKDKNKKFELYVINSLSMTNQEKLIKQNIDFHDAIGIKYYPIRLILFLCFYSPVT